jgi:hypothetical protein
VENAFGQDTPATLESIVNKLQLNK